MPWLQSHWSLREGDLALCIDRLIGGLSIGGLRIDDSAVLDDAVELARLMSVKLAACGVPIGGG